MGSVVRNMVEGIGIADSFPNNPLYFTQITIPETLVIPDVKPDIEELLSVMVDTKVLSVKVVDTPIATSNEGQVLTGNKLIIELLLKEKIKYIADEPTQSVHAAHFENVIKSVYVVVPTQVNDIPIKTLLAKNKVVVTPYIEDIYATMRDKRTIFKNVAILINVEFLITHNFSF